MAKRRKHKPAHANESLCMTCKHATSTTCLWVGYGIRSDHIKATNAKRKSNYDPGVEVVIVRQCRRYEAGNLPPIRTIGGIMERGSA